MGGLAARMWETKNVNKFWLENMKGRNDSVNLGVNRKITVKYILGK
jgi:hypothetical protein